MTIKNMKPFLILWNNVIMLFDETIRFNQKKSINKGYI
jgi:hypothetical protein